MRATLDTNTLASGTVAPPGGTIARIIEALASGAFDLVVSQHLLDEFRAGRTIMATRGANVRKTKTIKASDAAQQFDQLVDQVSREKTRVVLEKNGSSLAAIIPAHDLRRLQGLDAEEDALIARMRAAFSDLSEEQIVEDVARVIEEVRAERRRNNASKSER